MTHVASRGLRLLLALALLASATGSARADEDDHDHSSGSTGWMWWSMAADIGIDVGAGLAIGGVDPGLSALVGLGISLAGIGLGVIADEDDWSRVPATAVHLGLWTGGSLFALMYAGLGEVRTEWALGSLGLALATTALAFQGVDEGEALQTAWVGPMIGGGVATLLAGFFYLLADGYGEEEPDFLKYLMLPAGGALLGTLVQLFGAITSSDWNPLSVPCDEATGARAAATCSAGPHYW